MPPTSVSGDAAPQQRRGRGARVFGVLRYLLLAAVLVAIAATLWRSWPEVSAELARLDAAPLAAASVLALAPPMLTTLGWRTLLTDLGTRLPVPTAAGVFLVGQLGKYLPGSVWTVVVQTEMGRRLHVPRRRMAVAGMAMLGLSVLGGGVVSVPAVPVVLDLSGRAASPWWGLAALGLAVVIAWPPLLNWGIAVGLRLIRRPPLEHELSGGAVLRCMAAVIGAWVTSAAPVWVLARSLAPDAPAARLLLVCVCGFALASVAGMLAVVLPAGLGVRDAMLAVALATMMSAAAATAVVVVVRFLAVVVDLLLAAGAWWWDRRHGLVGAGGVGAGE
ncbi:MAG: lysylphosphatidylglycerol synthase domain-containing protein [Dermatophilaceae bacterium]